MNGSTLTLCHKTAYLTTLSEALIAKDSCPQFNFSYELDFFYFAGEKDRDRCSFVTLCLGSLVSFGIRRPLLRRRPTPPPIQPHRSDKTRRTTQTTARPPQSKIYPTQKSLFIM